MSKLSGLSLAAMTHIDSHIEFILVFLKKLVILIKIWEKDY